MSYLRCFVLVAAGLAACHSAPTPSPTVRPESANQLTSAERAEGWRLLFDGASLNGWRGLGYDSVPTAHWKVADGAIVKVAKANVARMRDGQPASGGDLMTMEAFRDFELRFDWKVSPGANSGVKYNVSEEMSMKSANHAALGFEYQVLDDMLHEDNRIPSHRAGSLYDIIASDATSLLRLVGEWNSSGIVFRGSHGEHWLNGAMIVSYDLGSPRMDSLVAASKYRSIPRFAERRTGHIVLQDHGDATFYRNIKIRELKQ